MTDDYPSSYFAKFPTFNPNPTAPLQQEFDRLASIRGWTNSKYRKERTKCLLSEYDLFVGTVVRGTSSEKLRRMQGLCIELGVSPVPGSVTACRTALHKVHVNIIDLLDSRRCRVTSPSDTLEAALQDLDLNNDPTAIAGLGQPVRVKVFKNIRQLQHYTRATGKYFPKNKAKSEGALGCLLREIN